MGLLIKDILGVKITIFHKEKVLEKIEKYLKKCKVQSAKCKVKKVKPLVIFTANPEIINYAQKDTNFKRIVNSAQINIPDGIGVSWAIKKLYGIEIERLSGADLMEDLCFWASENGARIGLIGGRDRLALSALECLREKHSNLKGWAADGPEIERPKTKDQKPKTQIKNSKINREKESNQAMKQCNNVTIKELDLGISDIEMKSIIDRIISEKTDILFVALGFPKQEYFIDSIKYQVSSIKYDRPLVLMSVGGTFDYITGRVARAPKWVRDRGLEWLYRLVREPWRFPRQLKGAEFFWKVTVQK